MTIILGITDGDDGGAAVLRDGRLVAAVNEERLNRLKMSIGFPRFAVREVLRLAGVDPGDVDRVAMAAKTEIYQSVARPNKGWFQEASAVARVRNEISSALARPLGRFDVARNAYRSLKRLTMGRRRAGVRRVLHDLGISAPISYHDHHQCHAFAAFHAAGYNDALSISVDGGGDGSSSHIYSMNGQGDELLNRIDSFDSIGNYYAYVTHLCGYRASIHEGKITGLAASGQPIYQGLFRSLITYEDGQIRNRARLYHRAAISALRQMLPADWEHADLAASIQAHLEDVVTRYVQYWLRRSGRSKICLSGGVFSNVLLNQRVADLPECESVFVFPAMGDGGLAAGAAASVWRALTASHAESAADGAL